MPKPQEGGDTDGRSTQAVVPQSIEFEVKEWTDGQHNPRIILTTQSARYRVEFGSIQFLEFTVNCLELWKDILRQKQEGS